MSDTLEHAKAEKLEQANGAANKAPDPARLTEVKVGAFVLVTMVAIVAIVMTLAQKRHVFQKRTVIHTVFADVQGLRVGAPVRLSGVDIGEVSKISFGRDRHASEIHVDMHVSEDSLERLGTDSMARIGSQGLLGDKTIELTASVDSSPAIAAGATLPSEQPPDFNKMMEQASAVLASAQKVADGAATLVQGVSDPKTLANVRGIIGSANKLAMAAEKGNGLAHALFFDPKQARAVSSLLAKVDQLSGHVDGAVRQVNALLGSTDKDGMQLVNNVSRAARNVGEAAGDFHNSKVIKHAEDATADLAAITAQIRSGQGTVGMAIMDPTVYEQLMVVLGGVNRSRVLRALVRYAIAKDDGQQKLGGAVDEPLTPAMAHVKRRK